jgi:hypothetical protein
MNAGASAVIAPLTRRRIFGTEEEAVRELVRDYTLRQIAALQRQIGRFERKYGMPLQRFAEYVGERCALLEAGGLSSRQRQTLGRALMQEEDDWLEWKVATEMLESWLGLRQEVPV